MNTLSRRSWIWLLIDGVLGVIVGIIALVWPGITVLALAVLLGIGLLVQGAVELSTGLTAFGGTVGRGWMIAFGILAIIAGIIVLARPGTGLWAIALGVAIWFFAAGINEITAARTLREDRAWNWFIGVLSIIAGIVVVIQPGAGLSAAAFVAGLMFLIRGVGEVALGMRLRQLGPDAVATPR